MKATIKQYNGKYEIIGITPLKEVDGISYYEMRYLYTFGGKMYKTLKNAVKAIQSKGFEFVQTSEKQLVCVYD